MKKLLIILCLITTNIVVNAQDELKVFLDWSTTEGTQNFFYKNVTKTDASNNVYIVGATKNSSNNLDILLAKYNSTGVLQWIRQYNGTGNGEDMGTGLFIDGSGNVYITGTTSTSSTNTDVITIKYNSSGTQQWLSTYNGTGGSFDSGADIKVDTNGDVFVTGSSYNTTPNTDFITIKYNSSGTQQWANAYNYSSNLNDAGCKVSILSTSINIAGIVEINTSTYRICTLTYNKSNGSFVGYKVSANTSVGIDQVNDMVVDASGNIYIAGATTSDGQGYNYDIIKLTTNLTLAWERTYNGASYLDDIANGIKVDASGNVYVTGYTTSSTEGKNITTIKYNSSGTQQWIQTYNDSLDGDDEAYAMAMDNSGNIYITGYIATEIDNADCYTVKYNSSGNVLWEIHSDGAAHLNDKATNIAIDNNGDIIVAGSSETAPGVYQYLTVKYVEKDIITPTDYNNEVPNSSYLYYRNNGQIIDTDGDPVSEIKYYAKNSSPEFYVKKDSYSFVFASVDTISSTTDTLHRIDVTFEKVNNDAKTYPLEETKSYVNYFLAQCPEGITEIRGNQRLITTNLYANIDMMYSSNQDGIKYYFIVKSGGDPTGIMMKYNGASSFNLDSTTNELTIHSSIGSITYERPAVYQLDANNIVDTITSWTADWYTDSTSNYYKFNIGAYNTSLPLIIQVDLGHTQQTQQQIGNLDWSTYYGGTLDEEFVDVETNSLGDVFVTGYSQSDVSLAFPTSNNPFQASLSGAVNAVVAKFDKNGVRKFATYLGGSVADNGNSILPDNATGNIFIVGGTGSSNFPMALTQPSGAYVDNTFAGSDAFIVELNSLGNQIIWSTFYGSTGSENFFSIKQDKNKDLYIVGIGTTNTPLLTLTNAYNNSTDGNGLITKFTNQGVRLWATLYKTGTGIINSVNTDLNDNVFITGEVKVSGMPITDPGNGAYIYSTLSGPCDAFIAKFNSSDAIVWSTYIGGSLSDAGKAITTNNVGDVFITGTTYSQNYPTYNPGGGAYFDNSLSGTTNSIISRFSNNGNMLWSTYHSSTSSFDDGNDIIASKDHGIFLTGTTYGISPLSLTGAYNQSTISNPSQSSDAYILCFNNNNVRTWASYFGGHRSEFSRAITIDIESRLYMTGIVYSAHNYSPSFPTVNPGNGAWFQGENANIGYGDGYIARFDLKLIEYGINDIENELFNVKIYPNPFNDILSVETTFEKRDNIKFDVYNIEGKLIISRNFQNYIGTKTTQIDLSFYNSGTYLIKISNSENSVSKVIIKQ